MGCNGWNEAIAKSSLSSSSCCCLCLFGSGSVGDDIVVGFGNAGVMPLASKMRLVAEAAGVTLAAMVAAAEGHTVWPSLKLEQQHLQKMHQ